MRQVIAGNGQDSTSATFAYLKANNVLHLKNLYLIGYPEDPAAVWLTDYESPLCWPVWGTSLFQNAVINRGKVTSKVGFDVASLDITWTPKNQAYSASTLTANPWQKAQNGYYDNMPVRVWTAYVLPGGDCMTYGASALFGGFIGNASTVRGKITFTVDSFLRVTNQMVPTNLIEMYSQSAQYSGATPPAGFSVIPQFNVIAGDSPTLVIGDCTNIGPHHIFGTNVLRGGYLVFNGAAGSPPVGGTLGPTVWSAIQQNTVVTVGGVQYNQFVLYRPLPWPPTPGVDTFYVSAPHPVDQSEDPEAFDGFLYVPDPSIGAT